MEFVIYEYPLSYTMSLSIVFLRLSNICLGYAISGMPLFYILNQSLYFNFNFTI